MKNNFIKVIFAVTALLMVGCSPDDEKSIVGNWNVQTFHYIHYDNIYDITEDETWDGENNYYDAAEFFDNGIMRWHLSDMFAELNGHTYDTLSWQINGDILILQHGPDSLGYVRWDYQIKEFTNSRLVIEWNRHENTYDEMQCYTLKRR